MIVGVDLGGTQVRLAIADQAGVITSVSRAATPELAGPQGTIAWLAAEVRRLGPGRRPLVVGVGVPGPCDPGTGVLINPPNLAGWPRNLPFGRLLAEALGAPVHLENDANLAALAELRRGAGRGVGNLVYVTWSTGIGAGLILGGQLYSGPHGSAGEIGHMVLDPAGPLCSCGTRGCTEAYASGSAIARRTGRPAAEVFAAALRGEREALEVVQDAAGMVGLALMNLANLVDPELIVMGGGITTSWGLVRRALY